MEFILECNERGKRTSGQMCYIRSANTECLLCARPWARPRGRVRECGWCKLRNQHHTVPKQMLSLKGAFVQNICMTEEKWFWISRSLWENLEKETEKWKAQPFGPAPLSCGLSVSPLPLPFMSTKPGLLPFCLALHLLSLKPRGLVIDSL